MDLIIYYIGYVTKKTIWSINSVNPLYLMINKTDGYFIQKNDHYYLIISNTDKNNKLLEIYNEVFDGI